MRSPDEAALLAAAAAGSIEARNRLVLAYYPLARWVAARHARTAADVEDLAQQGAIGIMRAIERFDPAKGYDLRGIVGWYVHREMQRPHVHPLEITADAPDVITTDTPFEEYHRASRAHALRAALASLPIRERRLVRLVHIDGMTRSRASEQVGVCRRTGYKLLSRALSSLAAALDPWRECRETKDNGNTFQCDATTLQRVP